LIPGTSFIIQNRITWFGRRFIRGGEEFRDGKGAFILGSEVMNTPYLDETERSLGWLYSLWLAPGSLINKANVAIDENEDSSVRIVASSGGKQDLVFNLSFDTESGQLRSIDSVRKGSRSGDDYPYQATLGPTVMIIEESRVPTSYTGDWDHDVYIKLELAGMQFNQDVSEAMQIGIGDLPN
jgi:hypothetical protein